MTVDGTKKLSGSPGSDIIDEVAQLVSEITGVQLGARQRTMVESRLSKRMSQLGLATLADYARHYRSQQKNEAKALVSLLTTHHTYFFRESSHFDYLVDVALPAVAESVRRRGDKTIRFWSAACSKGHESYTLAMLLSAHMPRIAPDLTFEIYGTDVDPESIATALTGVYNYREIKEIPIEYLRGNWSRGTGDISEWARVKPNLKKHCRFELGNLLDLSTMASKRDFDFIFCRNVFIYFTPAQVKSVTQGLLKKLVPGGLLFIGISESLNGMELPVTSEGPSIYRNGAAQTPVIAASSGAATAKAAPQLTLVPPAAAPSPVRVLCVDDSPSILAVLKKVLSRENGFEVVGTAGNGIEAARLLRTLTVDAMTLDIHMPEQSGLEYLQNNHTPQHPPVIMVSSVAREEIALAQRCLAVGASDYVEKPSLSNMAERGEEIRNKIRSALRHRSRRGSAAADIGREFAVAPAPLAPASSLRVIVATTADQSSVATLFRELQGTQPPTLLLLETATGEMQSFANAVVTQRFKVAGADAAAELTELIRTGSGILVGEFSRLYREATAQFRPRRTSILAFGRVSPGVISMLTQWSQAQVLIEDMGSANAAMRGSGGLVDVVPATSFAYMSNNYLSSKNG